MKFCSNCGEPLTAWACGTDHAMARVEAGLEWDGKQPGETASLASPGERGETLGHITADAFHALLREREQFTADLAARDTTIQMLQDEKQATLDRIRFFVDDINAANQTIQTLRFLLKKHGKHPDWCPKGVGIGIYEPPADAVCNCGIDAALTPHRPDRTEPTPHE